MKIASDYAHWNRMAIADIIQKGMNIKFDDEVFSVHNYIDIENMISRKGAISLNKGERAIISGSMQYGSIIVIGKGNKEFNCSGPHGFGRLMSRTKARETLKMEDFKKSMKGIYTTSISTSTIDEAPMAYKPPEAIISNLEPLCDIVSHIKPIFNLKAAE